MYSMCSKINFGHCKAIIKVHVCTSSMVVAKCYQWEYLVRNVVYSRAWHVGFVQQLWFCQLE